MPKTKRDFKKGDLVILEKGNNHNNQYEGQILEIQTVQATGNLRCKTAGDSQAYPPQITLYITNNADVFYHADRKKRAEYLKAKVVKLKEEIKKWEEMIANVKEFETEEDFIASQIQKILEVKDDRTAIANLVKKLQENRYI